MTKFLRLCVITFGVACAIGLIIGIIGWVVGWSSTIQFSNAFFAAGAILIVVGILSVMGGYGIRADFGVLYSQSAGDMNTFERSKRWLADTMQGWL